MEKRAKDFRQAAWEDQRGKWGTMALIAFVSTLITGACGLLAYIDYYLGILGSIALLLIGGALSLGMAFAVLTTARRGEPRVEMLFSGFRRFGASLALYLLIAVFTFLWTLLLIIPGIIKAYSYSMSYFILVDCPEMPANQARKQSMALMQGHKWRLFCLDLSFIGWWLLCILTLGILSFWVLPYQQTARAKFYQDLIGEGAKPAAPVAQDKADAQAPKEIQ